MNYRKLRTLLLVVLSVLLFASFGMAVGCKNAPDDSGNGTTADCTVTFFVDGGVAVNSKTVKSGDAIGELPVTSKDGYEFSGWSDVKDGSVNVDKNYVVTKDVTFYAVFRLSGGQEEIFCTITYSTSGTAVNSAQIKKGTAIGSLPFTDKRGYSFSGWFFDEELTDPVFTEDIITNDVTLYAGFEKQDVDSVLPEYTEISITTDDTTYEIRFECEKIVNESNLSSFITVTSLYGDLPKISVSAQGSGKYSLRPIGGYKNGGVYKIEITDSRVRFTDIDAAQGDDYTDDKTIKTVYLSVEAQDEELVSLKNGVFEINRSTVDISDGENKFTFKNTPNPTAKLPEKDSVVLFFGKRSANDKPEDDCYVKITEVKETSGKKEFYYVDCDDVDDVYEDFNINVGNASLTNERTTPENQSATNATLAEIAKNLHKSEGTKAITAMLANALNSSETIKTYASSDNPYRDNVSDVKGNQFKIEGLLDDLTINVTLGTAKNSSFNGIGISQFDDTRWSMLAIEFNYETDIKNNVKLEATITITQYLYVGLAASANKSSGDFKAEITPYSQTDIDFKILVCSISKDGDDDKDKKEEKKDISVEIEKLASGEGDSSNIIKDVQDMLENKGDAIELCKVPMFSAAYTIGGVISINIDLNFVIKVSFAAGVKIEATLLEATTIGVTGNYKTKTVDCYRRSAMGSDRYIFDFYAYGYLGVKAGISGELTVSFIGLKQVLRAGVGLEVGAYADLYGYLHYHAEERRVFKDIDTNGRHFQTLEGGVYFESGIYIELKAFVGVGKKEYGISKEFKFKLLEAGDKYLYIEACDNTDLTIVFNENDEGSVSLEGLIPAEGKFMDITTGEIETRVIPSKNIKVISNTNLFRVDGKNNLLVTNAEKIEPRLDYGIPYGTITLYYKGPNVLFSSSYLNENVPELKGFKELCKVTVVYLQDGVELDEETEFGKELTVNYVVKSELGEETVKTESVISGQYYKGGIPDEVIAYCHKNGLLTEVDGNGVKFDGLLSGKNVLKEDKTFVFETRQAQRFIAVRYKSEEDFNSDIWTADIMAMNYNELPTILDEQKYTPSNVFYEFFVITPDGNRTVMGSEYLSKYDLYMRGTFGFNTGEVLERVKGSQQELDLVFAQMKNGEGNLKDYSEFFTYTLEAEYITGMHTVYFYAPNGDRSQENVKYGETFKIPDYWITNINQSTAERLVGWDTDDDGKTDILPNQQFTVTRDMSLRPVMTAKGYTITVIGADGKATEYEVAAGNDLSEEILNEINSDPDTLPAPSENSFYSESYRTIITTDFVVGNDGYAYFKGVSMRYHGDITVMPACDIVITYVKGDLYHKVKIVDESDGYFTYKNENGVTVESKEITIAVKDGRTVGTSADYNAMEIKYHAPENVTFYSPNYVSENGEVLDFYNTIITKGITYKHTIFARYDGTYAVLFEYCLDTNGNVTREIRRNVVGITDEEKLNELVSLCNAEYDELTSAEYCKSLSDDEFTYSIDGDWSIKDVRSKDGYGITHITYLVYVKKTTNRYNLYWDFDAPDDYENYTDSLKYGEVLFVNYGTDRSDITRDKDGYRYRNYYKLIGYDTNGDGIVDVLPGDTLVVTKNVAFKAIYEKTPYTSTSLGRDNE